VDEASAEKEQADNFLGRFSWHAHVFLASAFQTQRSAEHVILQISFDFVMRADAEVKTP
jgi:hypothetical protein